MNLAMARKSIRFFLCLACLGLCGCSAASAILAMTKSTDQFVAYAPDPRVRYEPGAKELARQVATALPAAIRTVEQAQCRGFAAPVRVYVCGSLESFKAYGAPSGREGAFVLNKRLFVSPKPENTAQRMPGLLTHELSHLQIEQQLGLLKSARLPSWFKEGLAVYASKGAGAEKVTVAQAKQAIRRNEYFEPETEGSLLFPMRAHDYGLAPHLFYREAGMFIAHLNHLNRAKFKGFLCAVEDGAPLATAFKNSYGSTIESVWKGFLAGIKKTDHAWNNEAQIPRSAPLLFAGFSFPGSSLGTRERRRLTAKRQGRHGKERFGDQ